MARKKVLICCTQVPFNYGGAEVLTEELDTQLKARDYSSEIIRIPFNWYPGRLLVNQALIWRLLDLTESNGEKIDRVICTKYPCYTVSHKNKIVWLFHQCRQVYDFTGTEFSDFGDTIEDFNCSQQVKNIDNNTLAEARKIFTISRNVCNRLKKYNDIDSEVLYPPPKHGDRYYCESYGDYLFVAGRLDKAKRLDMLIKAMKYVKNKIQLIIAGTGRQEEELKALSKEMGLDSCINFKGFVADAELLSLYANCFAVYFSPFDEDFGFITIEAFKSRKPVITTKDSGGVLEFVEDGINGYITENCPVEIAKRIDFLYENRSMCNKFGEKGNAKVKNIIWDSVIEKLCADY